MKVRLTLLFSVLLANAGLAAEPPVCEGLVLWVDASAQGLRGQQPVDAVIDSSKRALRGFQLVPERRPMMVSVKPLRRASSTTPAR